MFTRKDWDAYVPVHLAIAVTNNKERVVVGVEQELINCFGGVAATVYYDQERRLGSFLLDFNDCEDDQWFDAMGYLHEELQWREDMKGRGEENAPLSEQEEKALKLLKEKYETGNPVCIYMALRLWSEYMCSVKDIARVRRGKLTRRWKKKREKYIDRFFERSIRVLYPVVRRGRCDGTDQAEETPFSPDNPLYAWPQNRKFTDMEAVIVYPSDFIQTEYAHTQYSLLGVKAYYASKLKEYNLKIARCKVCGRNFVANRKTSVLCGAKSCEAANKRNVRAEEDSGKKVVKKIFDNEKQRWKNKISKLRENESENADVLERLASAYETFKKELQKKRKEYVAGEITYSELKVWFSEQEEVLEEITEHR